MNIQIIGTSWGKKVGFDGIVQSPLSNPRSLDEFDVNIIDLSCANLWYYRGKAPTRLNQSNNLLSVQQMVCNSVSTNIIYVLPMSIALQYDALHDKYYSSLMLKDDLDNIRNNILNQVLFPELPPLSLLFENTRTEINNLEYEADFYFRNGLQEETKSKLSNKTTTISLNERVLATTLDISSSKEKLINFVTFFYEDSKAIQHPTWFSEVSFYDDSLQKDIIRESEAEIARAKQAIDNARSRLAENDKYKSILHTNGADLVHVVFSILEQLLGCDLSEFEDKKNEDFLIRLDHCTLIGEIKGVTSNVKNDHIGQIEHHYQRYMDELEEKQISEDVHQLLIISPFRTKAPNEREPINDKQISLAKRNGCLIIETKTLLKIFERYLENSITSAQCIQLFCTRTGLLQITDIPLVPEEDIAEFMV